MKNSNSDISTGRTLAGLAAVTFAASLIVFGLQARIPLRGAAALAGAVLLTAVLTGAAYWLVLRPLRRERAAPAPAAGAGGGDTIDTTTRTLNRRGITIGLLDLMALADRYNHQLSVAMVDIDRLGQINAEYGNPAGDRVLASIAGALTEELRMPDRVGRYSANEFLLVLPETDLDSACKLAERIRQNTAQTAIDINGKAIKTTISIGVTQFREGEDLEQLVSRSERAILDAKQKGRNCVVCTPADAA